MKKNSLPLIFLLCLGACSTKRDLPEKVYDLFEKQSAHFTRVDPNQRESRRAILPTPFNLAVHFRPPVSGQEKWSWNPQDKVEVFSALEEIKGGRLGRIFELEAPGISEEAKALRAHAREMGADALLLVQGLVQVDSELNPWALSYLVVAPLLFVKGNDVSSAFVSQALLWDVREPHVHLGVQSEGEWEMRRPAVFKQKTRAIRKSREESLKGLTSKLKKNFTDGIL